MKRKDLYGILEFEAERRGWTNRDHRIGQLVVQEALEPAPRGNEEGRPPFPGHILPTTLRNILTWPFEILVGGPAPVRLLGCRRGIRRGVPAGGYIGRISATGPLRSRGRPSLDAYLIGLALRIGIRLFGAFDSVYTDNGKPECSRYMTAILANIRSLGMEWKLTDDVMMDLLDVDGEDIDPHLVVPGEHRKAVVKNAKAKMIERTNYAIEQILASRIRIPGSVKRLSDDIHAQDIDHHEAQPWRKPESS
jgi:hypothetical protein